MSDPYVEPDDGGAPISTFSIEIATLRDLVEAMASLQSAALSSGRGFVDDYCQNALAEVRKAMRAAGG